MPIPQHILSVERPKNTVVTCYGKNDSEKNSYMLNGMKCKNTDGFKLHKKGKDNVKIIF